MKLYYHPNSQPSRTSLAVARYLGLEVETEVVALMKGQQRSPEYLAINPNGKVPALIDGELCLWESSAIQSYLAEKAGANELWPADPMTRADIERWRCWAMTTWNGPLGTMTFERLFKPMFGMGDLDESAVTAAEDTFRQNAAILDAHLAGRRWVVGEALTLGDLSLASMLTYWEPARVPLESFPEIRRWYGQVEELPCWQETVPPPAS